MERRAAASIGRAQGRAELRQSRHHLRVALARGQVQRRVPSAIDRARRARRAVGRARLNVLQQRAHRSRVTWFGLALGFGLRV